jgi:hypothetical protein
LRAEVRCEGICTSRVFSRTEFAASIAQQNLEFIPEPARSC